MSGERKKQDRKIAPLSLPADAHAGVGNCFGFRDTPWPQMLAEGRTFQWRHWYSFKLSEILQMKLFEGND